jgi:hypothetical protein
MRNINQHPWTQANTREIGLIGAQGHLVIAAASIIIPRGRVHVLLCQEFKIKHVEWVHMSFLSPSFFRGITAKESVTHPFPFLAPPGDRGVEAKALCDSA